MTEANQAVQVAPVVSPVASPRMAPSVLLMGDVNMGKTHTIHSIVAQGIKVRYLACEPGFEDVLGSIPPDMLAWNYVAPFRDDMAITMSKVELVMKNTDQALKAMGGVKKERHTQLLDMMKLCNNFIDLRTGQEFGDVADFTENECFFLDGLSGLTQMAIKVKIGDKPFLEQNDYFAVQAMLRDFINTLVANTRCLFVMTAHVEFEKNPMTGLDMIMPSTAGQKLAPEIARYFSDAIMCKRQLMKDGAGGTKLRWYWDNVDPTAKVKFRNLPPGDNHPADFGPLIKNWRVKGEGASHG